MLYAAARGYWGSILVGLFMTLSINSSAQAIKRLWSRPNAVKTNLLAPVSLFYDRALTPRLSVRTSMRALKLSGKSFKEQSFINATLECKIYTARINRLTAKEHPAGFFINPYLKGRSLRVVDQVRTNPDVYEPETIKSVGFGLTIGYQWVSNPGVVVEVFNGIGAMPPALSQYRRFNNDGTVTTKITNDYYTMDVRAGVGIGYTF